ncbi:MULTISPECIES: hypothetical protein [unclassified Streptomyces]|uniref:helix-turn-helix transcriptional regulator n=1 Tax=unclassified Streptomyces TaxID=2593676 RepID=UPI003324D109
MPTEQRKLAKTKPPAGLIYIEDHEDDNGSVTPGIASRLGITPSTYRKWRMVGKGPHAFRLGKHVVARVEAVDRWVKDREFEALPAAA